MSTKRIRTPALLAAAVALFLPVSASNATVLSSTTQDGIDHQDPTPTLDDRPEAVEITGEAVRYDSAAGTVTVVLTFNQGLREGQDLAASAYVAGQRQCASDELGGPNGGVPRLSISLSAGSGESEYDEDDYDDDYYEEDDDLLDEYADPFAEIPDVLEATAKLGGFQGSIDPPLTVSDDGRTLVATFQHRALVGLDYRCAFGWDESPGHYEDDEGSGDYWETYFEGLAPQPAPGPAAPAVAVKPSVPAAVKPHGLRVANVCGAVYGARPRQFVMACGDGNYYLSKMRWSAWGGKVAKGVGTLRANDCNPFCAAGHFHSERVRVRLFYPHTCAGEPHRYYRRGTLVHADGRREKLAVGGCPGR